MDGQLTLSLDEGSGTPEDSHAIFTLPNLVTMVRLALIPVFVWLLFGAHETIWAASVLAFVGITDWVDGQLARRLNQVSELGKILDPVADRILMITAVISTAVVGAVPWWFAGLSLAREVLISAATIMLAALGAKRIDVVFVGKAGTFALMVSYPLFLLGHGTTSWQAWVRVLAWIIGLIGLTLSWAALIRYVGPAREALRSGRARETTT